MGGAIDKKDVKLAFKVKADLGECPLWSTDDQCLYWLDIEGQKIHRFDPRTGQDTDWNLPDTAGCFVFREGGGAVIAAHHGYYDVDFATGNVKKVAEPAHDPKRFRFNDGKTDRQGRLWAGTVKCNMHEVFNPEGNAYYRYDGRTVEVGIPSPVGVVNGTAFSTDGKTMYRSQTDDRKIFVYDFDPATGTASRGRLFATVPEELGCLPDGATVDTEGGYWSAWTAGPQGGKGYIARYTSDGQLDFKFEMPVPMPTMMAFGGADMSTLYFTSGRLEKYMQYKVPEDAGSIFMVETKFRGVPEAKFRYR